MVDCAQRFGVYLQLVLLHLLQCAAAVDPYALVLKCANEVVQQLARREASALNLNALADLQRHLSLIEDEGHDLIGLRGYAHFRASGRYDVAGMVISACCACPAGSG